MNPWLAERLVTGRMEEYERAALRGGVGGEAPADPTAPLASPHRSRPALARHLGVALIALGRRLADGDTLAGAFETSHRT